MAGRAWFEYKLEVDTWVVKQEANRADTRPAPPLAEGTILLPCMRGRIKEGAFELNKLGRLFRIGHSQYVATEETRI